jgi:uncharacterized protein (UPF0218 family)
VASWLQADSYPRIDKIEQMAKYFHVTKSDLVEVRGQEDLAQMIMRLSPDKQALVRAMIEQLGQ